MENIPEGMPLVEEETTTVSSNGASYVCKRTYQDAYKKIVNWYDEHGFVVKQKVTSL